MTDINNSAKFNKLSLMVAVLSAMVAGTASAAPPDVTAVVAEVEGAAVPIAAVAGASLGVYVGLRVWKMVRRAI